MEGNPPGAPGPGSAAKTYTSLNYAPRQRNAPYRASQAFQSHQSLFHAQAATSSPLGPSTNSASVASDSASASSIAPVADPAAATAAAKLQLQLLKAEAQSLGLGPQSVGWAMLGRVQSAAEGEWAAIAELVGKGEVSRLVLVLTFGRARSGSEEQSACRARREGSGVWRISYSEPRASTYAYLGAPAYLELTSSSTLQPLQATLLLPQEPLEAGSAFELSLPTVYDHVLLSAGSSRPSPSNFSGASLPGIRTLATLSGLRGEVEGDDLILKSFIPRADLSFIAELRNQGRRG